MKIKHLAIVAALAISATACDNNKKPEQTAEPVKQETHLSDKYAQYTLTTNIDHLSDNEKQMLPLLFEACDIMNGLFWRENYGDKAWLLSLKTAYSRKNINFDTYICAEENTSLKLAQEVMNLPITKALKNIAEDS